MKKALVLAVCLLCLTLGTRAARAADTTWYPGTIPLGLDARSLGMGGACLAVIDPRTSPANPAALVFVTDQGLFAGRYVDPVYDPISSRAEQQYVYLFYVHPNGGNGAYSVGVFQNAFTFNFAEDAFTHDFTRFTGLQYGYGYPLSDRICLGFNLRQIQSLDGLSTGDMTNQFMTADVGAVFRLNEAIAASVLVTDVLSPLVTFEIEGEDYYYAVRSRLLFGGSFRLGSLLLLAADIDFNIAGYDDLWYMTRAGVELRLLPFLALRGGYYHGQPTVGVGLKLGKPDRVQVNLDFGQYWPKPGEYLNVTQCLEMVVYL